MPTYQYACTACDHQFETVQSFADDPLTQCPACEGRLRKLFGSVGVVFKGSGFYRTDSRASESGNGTQEKKESSTEGSTSTGQDSESKASGSEKNASGSEKKSSGESGSTDKTPAKATASSSS